MPACAPRLIVGNLDAEIELSGSPTPKRAVLEMISAAAASLGVFARAGDQLWTPAPVAQERVLTKAATMVSGPLDQVLDAGGGEASAILAWGQTPRVARLRRAALSSAPPAVRDGAPWRELLWQLAPSVAAARRCNDRSFGHRLAQELGEAPSDARLINSVAELESLLAVRRPGPWVVKAPLSASGRDRLRLSGAELSTGTRTRLQRLFERGTLLFEPWLDRIVDIGVVGIIHSQGCLQFPPHRIEVDAGGVFRGITLDDRDSTGEVGLTPVERDRLEQVVARVARELRAASYQGPFGVDAFVYRDSRGERALVGLCEINARLTFGHVARAHAEARGLEGYARFGLGSAPSGERTQLIVAAAAPDGLTVWITDAREQAT